MDHIGFRPGDRALRWLIWAVWFVVLTMFTGIGSGLRGTSGVTLIAGLGWITGVMAAATLGALVVWKRRSLIQGWLLTGFAFFWTLGPFLLPLLRLSFHWCRSNINPGSRSRQEPRSDR